jgi:uncharacterized protein YbjT (DUF2867 family)
MNKTDEKRIALVVGATGLVGSLVIEKLLKTDKYHKIRVLTRKPLSLLNPRLESIIFDFENPDSTLVWADDVFCCLGTTMAKAGSKEAFYKVDFTYPFQVATMALANNAKRFAIVTAMGADVKSMVYYNRVKGEIEDALRKLSYESLLIFRPSLLLGNRPEKRIGEQFGEWFMKLLKPIIPTKYRAVEAEKVANAMVIIATSSVRGTVVYESDILQEF